MRIKLSAFYVGCIIFLLSCNDQRDKKIIIDFDSPAHDSTTISFHEDEAIHVAIASISSPRESYQYYNELLNHIASKINIPIHSIQKQSYKQVNQLLLDGAVDFAFVSSGAYIDFDPNQVELLVAPIIDGQNHYHSLLITNKNNNFEKLEDLKDKRFAFSDPLSHTGFNYPVSKILAMGENPQHFFSEVLFSFGHDLSIEMVNREMVDGAYVHGMIYDFIANSNQEKIINTRVIEISGPFGIPPVICSKQLDHNRFELYQEIFLNLHKENEGIEILKRLNIDRFEKVDDQIYNSVRAIKRSIGNETF